MGGELRAGFLEERVGKIKAWKGRIRVGAARLGVIGHGGLLFYPCVYVFFCIHLSVQTLTYFIFV